MNIRKLFVIACMLGIAGCTTLEKTTEELAGDDPEILFKTGQYAESAKKFLALAERGSGSQKIYHQLRAVAALARADQIPLAKQWLQQTQVDPADMFNMNIARLASASIALAERKPNEVQMMLTAPLDQSMKAVYQAEFHGLRASAYTLADNRLETARELVIREKYLTESDSIQNNQKNIWSALASMNERSLQQLRTAPPPDTLSGWMELVQISKVYQLSPERLKEQLFLWQNKYPQHPVSGDMLAGLMQRKQEDVAYPDRIALLLPLSGKFSKAGEALRDGFLASYYTRRPNKNQQIRIYDVTDNDAAVKQVYEQAVKDGAQFVVGPLTKEGIQQINSMDEINVPTLALNYLSDDEGVRSNLYQFGLSPEEEARQVAERTWLDGHVSAAVLVPHGPWGERIYESFKQRWETMGGKIAEMQTYESNIIDFSQPIQMLLNIDDSTQRYRRVATTLKREIKFTSRRRQDIDFIFIAAYPRQARQIRPQLKFYHASDLPVYATSHVYTGALNQERDRDMDGLIFGDMPWVLAENTAHRGLRAEIETQISDAGNALQRLYALGVDAFNIIGALQTLRTYPYERFDGETGSLSLDNQLRIRRQLTWVRFRSGRPISMDQGNL